MDTTHFHPYRSAKIMLGKDCVGLLGDIHPQYGKNIVMAELDFDALIDVKKSKIKFLQFQNIQVYLVTWHSF